MGAAQLRNREHGTATPANIGSLLSRSRIAEYTGLVIVNLYAFRDTDPRNLRLAPDAVGPANDEVLRVITKAGAQTIAAWGTHGRLHGRSGLVGPLLDSPMCLGITQRGEPRHPLSVPGDTKLVPWVPIRPVESDPTNSDLTASLLRAAPAAHTRLRAAIEVMKCSVKENSIAGWSPRTGNGSTSDPHVLPHPEYDEAVPQLIAARRSQCTTCVRLDAMGPIPAVCQWRRVGTSPRTAGSACSSPTVRTRVIDRPDPPLGQGSMGPTIAAAFGRPVARSFCGDH